MRTNKKTVLFLCTHNSCRSQMAEGLLNTFYKDNYKAFSAGVEKTNVNPYAVEVMKELDIDLSKHYSKNVEEFKGKKFDFVVTVCDNAREVCPFFPGKKIIHKNFVDPAKFKGENKDILENFRRVRNEIKSWIMQTF